MEYDKTIRQEMIEILKQGPLTARELSQILHVTEKEAISHLYHVQKSALPEYELQVDSAVCRGCGYQFETRKRLSKPSKCPKCRQQTIAPPCYFLEKT